MLANGLAGAATGGMVGALAGVGMPIVVRAAALSVREMERGWQRRVELVTHAGASSGVSAEDILAAAEADDHRAHLLTLSADAASTSTYPERIRVLAEALARGLLGDEEAVDREQLFVRAVGAIDRPHLFLMQRMLNPYGGLPFPVHVEAISDYPPSPAFNWEELTSLAGRYEPTLDPILATLTREGLVNVETEPVTAGTDAGQRLGGPRHVGERWRLSPFGMDVVARLHSFGDGEAMR